MNINEFIEKKCPYKDEDSDNGIHDRAYARALEGNYLVFKDCALERLKMHLDLARESYRYDNSHTITARCVILYELIEEKKLDKSE